MAVHATVQRRDDAYALLLSVESSSGEAHRELTDSDCAALAEGAALLVALARNQASPLTPRRPRRPPRLSKRQPP